jgi:hypothetical protein
VPTRRFADRRGYSSSSITIISEPDPTEVIPTMKPPVRPMRTVAVRFITTGSSSGGGTIAPSRMRAKVRALSNALTTIETAATMSAQPSNVLTSFATSAPLPRSLSTNTPTKAAGTEPTTSQRASDQFMVPRRK